MESSAEVSTTQIASALARLILAGREELIAAVADYGLALTEGEAVTEAHRQGMAKAVSQFRVVNFYAEAVQQLGENFPARARLLRQIALYVYLRREGARLCQTN